MSEQQHTDDPKPTIDFAKLNNINWGLLVLQKNTLIALYTDKSIDKIYPDAKLHLDGVINLIDAIQDSAAEVLGEETVFGSNLEDD